MSYSSLENYPDILGFITNNIRANISVLQIATALRPRVAMAGRPLEMLLLLQNASDVAVDVSATLTLPALDAKKQKGRFISKADRILVTVEASSVGLITLPLSTLPDTAVSADYKIGIEIKVTPNSKEKPRRIRQQEGGGVVDEALLPEKNRELIDTLKKLPWSATLANASTIITNLTIMSGKVGAFADLQPSWISLWTTADYWDETFLLHRFSRDISGRVLPQFTRATIFPVLKEAVEARFKETGYKLQPKELETITRLLTLMLEYANPHGREMIYMTGEKYNLKQYFDEDGDLLRKGAPISLPRWAKEMLKVFHRDERTLQFPLQTVARFGLDALLRDAMHHSFERIETMTGIHIGTTDEAEAYIDHFFEALNAKKLTFDLCYMPLLIGAFALTDGVVLKGEKSQQLILDLRGLLELRFSEQTEETRPTYDIAQQVLEQTAGKYNFSEW